MLIVDDEKLLRHGIIHSFDWPSLNIGPVYEARNGDEGYKIYCRVNPDIVITDIRMPIMDGIAFTNAIRQINTNTIIIYITGHSDVEFLKSAIKVGTIDYILKPIEPEELKKALDKAVMLCAERQEQSERIRKMEELINQSRPYYIKECLHSLLVSNHPSSADLLKRLVSWSFPLIPENDFIVAVIALDGYDEELSHGAMERTYFLSSAIMEDRISQLIEPFIPSYIFRHLNGNYICILRYTEEDGHERIRHLLHSVRRAIENESQATVTIAIGTVVNQLVNVSESYAYAILALRQRFLNDGVRLYESGKDNDASIEDRLEVEPEIIRRVRDLILTVNTETLLLEIDHLIEPMKYNVSLEIIQSFCSIFIAGVFLALSEDSIQIEQTSIYATFSSQLYSCTTYDEICILLKALMNDLSAKWKSDSMSNNEKIVHSIKNIVNRNLADSVTIADISKKIFITPAYLCTIFKAETGITINDYITNQRMEKAKTLILSGQYLIYEIAHKVGYQDVKYFSQLFKRKYRLTPSEYQTSYKS